jgi:hypothetical protein
MIKTPSTIVGIYHIQIEAPPGCAEMEASKNRKRSKRV